MLWLMLKRRTLLISGDDYQAYKINLSAQVKMEYYTLWLFDKKIDVEEADIKLLNELINSVTILYQVNKINQADLLTLKSEVASNKTQLLILQNQKEAETYKLNKLLGRDLDSKGIYTEKEIHIDSLNSSMNELQSKLEEMNPSLKKMDNMIDMNIAMENANEKDLVPDLMVQGMIMRMPQGMILTEKSDSFNAYAADTIYVLIDGFNYPTVCTMVGK